MKVFISWSGEKSRLLAEAIRSWLPAVIQNVKPFFTPEDVEKGARWGQEIAKELELSSVGIFCLTPDNITKPWIMFEAGALSKKIESARICPILFGLEKSDLEGPLVQFQAISFSYDEMQKMLFVINNALGESKLDDVVLRDVFDMWWPNLEKKVELIINHQNSPSDEKENIRSDRDILEEVLGILRVNTVPFPRPSLNINAKAFIDIVKGVEGLIDQFIEEKSIMSPSLHASVLKSFEAMEYMARKLPEGRVSGEEVLSYIQAVRIKLNTIVVF
jgi:hypothetical protein